MLDFAKISGEKLAHCYVLSDKGIDHLSQQPAAAAATILQSY